MSHSQVTPGQTEPAEDFDSLMALEISGGQPSADANDNNPASAPATPAADGQDPSGGQAASGEGGVDDDGGGSTATPGATDDWLSTLPDEVQQRIREERERVARELKEHEDRFKALHERVAPTQRQLSETQMRLNQLLRQQPPAHTAPDPSATDQEVDSFYDSAEWKEYEATFPGDAKVQRMGFEAQRKEYRKELSKLEGKVQQLTQRLAQTEEVTSRTSINEELRKLEEAHSDWMDINQSDEFWSWFDGWRAKQPKSLRDQFYDPNTLDRLFNDAEFVIGRVDEFKAQRQPATPSVTPSVPQTPAVTPESTQPAQTQPAPNARLSMSVAPEVRGGSPVPQAVPLDSMSEAEQFEHLFRLEQSQS